MEAHNKIISLRLPLKLYYIYFKNPEHYFQFKGYTEGHIRDGN